MRLAYDVYTPPGDIERNLPPVVLLHGMLDSRKTWKNIAPVIVRKTGRKVYAVDARNHGESPWSPEHSFDTLADDLDEFLEQRGLGKACLVGHSMGGRTAATLALKKPEKVQKLVVEDMNLQAFRPSFNSPLLIFVNLMRDSLENIPPGTDDAGARKHISTHFKSILGQDGNSLGMSSSYDRSMMPIKKSGNSYGWQTNLKVVEEFLTTDMIRQTLSGVYMGDALFLYGPASFFKVDKDASISKYFPRAIKLGIENANHLVHFTHVDRFNQEVTNFINGCRSKY